MVKQIISSAMAVAVTLCLLINSATAQKFSKDDEWLIYMYICGTNLEENFRYVSTNIAEMQQVKLPKNVKVLINIGGAKTWYHPTFNKGGNGIYLLSKNNLEQLEAQNLNMGDPNTLASFLEYGEKNFNPDHRILVFWNHGGLNGICYDDAFQQGAKYNLTYDNLTQVLSAVYPNSQEELPFELIAFNTCVSAPYELAESVADFSHYMVGSESNQNKWYYGEWISALAKNPSMNGAQIGKIICDSAFENYDETTQLQRDFSVIDLTKMPQLREAHKEFFSKALELSNESTGFKGAFARAAEARTSERYSDIYTDLWNLAKNIKDLMPKESKNLRKAIKSAVVYNRHGKYFKDKGISTYYPYLSTTDTTTADPVAYQQYYLKQFFNQKSALAEQKNLYRDLLNLDISNLQDMELDYDSHKHIVARLAPEELENISSVRCIVLPVIEGGDYNLGLTDTGTVVLHSDDVNIDRKKGTVTENFRAVEPLFDGHKIWLSPSTKGHNYNFYEVPIMLNSRRFNNPNVMCILKVRYDIPKKEYNILDIIAYVSGTDKEGNPVIQPAGFPLQSGDIITPIFLAGAPADSLDSNNAVAIPTKRGETAYLKFTASESFIYMQDSKIIDKKINNGKYACAFQFIAPNGKATASEEFFIDVKYNEVTRYLKDDIDEIE